MAGHLLENRSTRFNFGQDRNGLAVDSDSDSACAWCLVGAIRVVNSRVRHCHPSHTETVCALAVELLGIPDDKASSTATLFRLWDSASPEEWLRIIARLKSAGLETP